MRNVATRAGIMPCAVALALLASASSGAGKGDGQYKETVLYSFCGQAVCSDGGYPLGDLIADAQGNLYGTTFQGGANSGGIAFQLTPRGNGHYTETVLYSFCAQADCADGEFPRAGLIADAENNLYGTTAGGGSHDGVVFEFTPKGNGHYKETVLHSFSTQIDYADGTEPLAGLIADAQGNLYGTTIGGGANCTDNGGCGTVFKLTPKSNGTYKETVLYSFCAQDGCADGDYPHAGLIADAQGNLYGTTSQGAVDNGGAVFELTPRGNGHYKETVLYSFCAQANCADGEDPQADLIADPQGNLYGTTVYGGANNGGAVFKVTPRGKETALYSFCAQDGCTDGSYPVAGLIADAQGNLYGTTPSGGVNGGGTAFRLTHKGREHYKETVLYTFCAQTNCADGNAPFAGLIADAQGNLYGTTTGGGAKGDYGTVFELKKK
jgi:uncharacterized repeat protein (TIGR03803 family)